MYSYEERIKAVRLLIQYDMRSADVRRELGYPSKQVLYALCPKKDVPPIMQLVKDFLVD